MLSNLVERGKEKGCAYWPTSPSVNPTTYGAFTVSVIQEGPLEKCKDITLRKLEVTYTHSSETRLFVMYHYLGWPDHGVPRHPTGLAELLRRTCNCATSGPLVVHCSAGVGRSGVLVTSHVVLNAFRAHLKVGSCASEAMGLRSRGLRV